MRYLLKGFALMFCGYLGMAAVSFLVEALRGPMRWPVPISSQTDVWMAVLIIFGGPALGLAVALWVYANLPY